MEGQTSEVAPGCDKTEQDEMGPTSEVVQGCDTKEMEGPTSEVAPGYDKPKMSDPDCDKNNPERLKVKLRRSRLNGCSFDKESEKETIHPDIPPEDSPMPNIGLEDSFWKENDKNFNNTIFLAWQAQRRNSREKKDLEEEDAEDLFGMMYSTREERKR